MEDDLCSDRSWGFLATDVSDVPACVSECRQNFLKTLMSQEETFQRVCERLSNNSATDDQEEAFWVLYCCDSQLCGVNNLEREGQDPNVNWVINACQNIGYNSIGDPGPPKRTFSCSSTTLSSDESRCQKKAPSRTTSQSQSLESSPTPTTSDSTSMETLAQSSLRDPSLEESLNPNKSNDDQSGYSGELSIGVKVTVALSSVVGALLLSLAVFCIYRYRSKSPSRRSDLRQLIKRDAPPPPRSESPTPLVSPTISRTGPDGAPLTPPPPLKERKMLDVGVSSRPSSAGQPQPRVGHGFPASPVFAPTISKLVPRHERNPRAYGAGVFPPVSPLGSMATAEGSLRSVSSNPTMTTIITTASPFSAAAMSSTERIAATPPKYPSLRDLAQVIPSPGPPPTRALPWTPPPSGPTTQPSTAASSIRHGDIGVAIGVVTHNPADGVVLEQEARDLCEMTKRYGLEARSSWDSWGGGVAPVTAHKRGLQSPVMQEEDLERLGGRY